MKITAPKRNWLSVRKSHLAFLTALRTPRLAYAAQQNLELPSPRCLCACEVGLRM